MTSRRLIGICVATALLATAAPAAAQRGPAPVPAGLPAEVLSLACAPAVTFQPIESPIRITGGQEATHRLSYSPGDLVTISAGTRNGIQVGQQFFVRRHLVSRREKVARDTPATIRTAGWIRVYAVDETMSLATVTHACDTIQNDDYLEPFVVPVVPAVSTELSPAQRENYGRVLVGQDRRRSFGKGDYFTVNRGSDHGVTVGTQFVLYRDRKVAGNFLFDLGEAVAVEVRPDSSTMRITVSRDAIAEGDYAAMRR